MNYIENIYICLAAPLFISILCIKRVRKGHTIFLLAGMTACFLSSYVTTYLTALIQADRLASAVEFAPFVEELMKFAPIVFYLLTMTPKKEVVAERVLMVSVGFATFENVCYLVTNGSDDLVHLLIRGFGTGAMHMVCGTIVAVGLVWLWDYGWLRIVGTIGLLAVSITYHGVYNILVAQTGAPRVVGFLIPLLTLLIGATIRKFVTGRRR